MPIILQIIEEDMLQNKEILTKFRKLKNPFVYNGFYNYLHYSMKCSIIFNQIGNLKVNDNYFSCRYIKYGSCRNIVRNEPLSYNGYIQNLGAK